MSAIETVSINSEANNLSTLEAFEDSRDLSHGFTKECFMKMPVLFKHANKTFSASKPQFYEKTHLIAYPHLMADGKLKDRGIFLPQSIIADKLKTAIEEDELPLAYEAKHAFDKGLCYGLNLMHIYRRFSSEEELHFQSLQELVESDKNFSKEKLLSFGKDLLFLHGAYKGGRQLNPDLAINELSKSCEKLNLSSQFHLSSTFSFNDSSFENLLRSLLEKDLDKDRTVLFTTGNHSFSISYSDKGLLLYNPLFGKVQWNELSRESIQELSSCLKDSLNISDQSVSFSLEVLSSHELQETKKLDYKSLIKPSSLNLSTYNGSTALYNACLSNQDKMVSHLLQLGVEINKADNAGNTPLIAAAYNGNELIVDLLLSHGADVLHSNHEGASAYLVAKQCGFEAIAKKLEKLSNVSRDNEFDKTNLFSPLLNGANFSAVAAADLAIGSMQPSSTLMGAVDMSKGRRVDQEVDACILSAEPLLFQRNFADFPSSPYNIYRDKLYGGGFHINHPRKAYAYNEPIVHEPAGGIVTYGKKGGPIKDIWEMGLTNIGPNGVSSTSNYKNQYVELHEKRKSFNVYLKDGGIRHFKRAHGHYFFIDWEQKSNGNKIFYEHDANGRITLIKGCNSRDENVFGWIKLNYMKDSETPDAYLKYHDGSPIESIETSDGQKAQYHMEFKKYQGLDYKKYKALLNKVTYSNRQECSYVWDNKDHVSFIKGADGRFLAHQPYVTGSNQAHGENIEIKNQSDARFLTIRKVYAPDDKGAPKLLFSFKYESGGKNKYGRYLKTSECYHALGGKTVYHHSPEGRLERIDYYKKNEKTLEKYRSKCFYWAPKTHPHPGHLLSATIEDEAGNAQYCESYRYDSKGNPIKKTLYGDLSGEGKKSFIMGENGYPISQGVESYSTHYTYYDDPTGRFHLIKEIKLPNGKVERYTYKKGTDLVSAIFTYDKKKLLTRNFFFYDKNAALVKSISDDGKRLDPKMLSGVTQRLRTRYKNRTVMPAYGLPEEIIEEAFDPATKKYQQLKKTKRSYSPLGYLEKERVYSSKNSKLLERHTTYDSYGRAASTTNELGETKRFTYDENGNLLKEKGPENDRYTLNHYDYNNRLVKGQAFAKEVGEAGFQDKTTKFSYNPMGLKREELDAQNHETSYYYDTLGRLIAKDQPKSIVSGEEKRPRERFSYDIFDRVIASSDTNRKLTKFSYNVRGDKTSATYPDGTQEKWFYTLSGKLKKHVDVQGVETHYHYDVLGRCTLEKVKHKGKTLRYQQWTYNHYHLLEHRDYLGCTTNYFYDASGREQMRCTSSGAKERYLYDDLDRVVEKQVFYGKGDEDYTAFHYKYDKLSRVLEESIRDSSGQVMRKVGHSYNSSGERVAHIQFHRNGKAAESYVHYDSRNRPYKIIDENKECTSFEYKDIPHPKLSGKKLSQVTTTDTVGTQKVIVYNEYGNHSSEKVLAPKGNTLSEVFYEYDLSAKLTKEKHKVYLPNGKSKVVSYLIEKEYDEMGRISKLIENSHKKPRVTSYSYDSSGRLKELTKPNGLVLTHKYDALGRLKRLSAPKGYSTSYAYDKNDNIIEIVDRRGVEKFITKRSYDEASRLIKETLGNGYSLSYEYDDQNRVTKLKLEDGSAVEYSYNAQDLTEIKRILSDQSSPYSQSYLSYDYDGKLLNAKNAEDLSQNYDYDKKGRLTHFDSPSLNYTLNYDASGNLKAELISDALGDQDLSYEYNYLNQLTKEKQAGIEKHSYSYDSLGNRLEKDGSKNAHDVHNALTRSKDEKRSYDKNGNLTKVQQGNKVYLLQYDALDRLKSISCDGLWKKAYAYDAFNRRLYEESYNFSDGGWHKEKREHFLFFGQREMGSFEQDKSLKTFRALDPTEDSEIASAIGIEIEGNFYIPYYDSRGSIAALCDPKTSEVKEVYRYDAYGGETIFDSTGNELDKSAIKNPWRFSSKRICEDSHLVYFGERYYDASQGIWITTDPNGFADGPNLYAYVHNSPLSHTDEYGLWGVDISSLKSSVSSSFHTLKDSISEKYKKIDERYGASIDTITGVAVGFFDGPVFGSIDCAAGYLNDKNGPYSSGYAAGMSMAGALYFIGAGEAKDVGVGAIKALSSLYKRAKFVKKEIQAVNLTGAKGVKHAERYFNISSSNPAQNANAQIALGKKLSALQGAQKDAIKIQYLPDGRVRYYDIERFARSSGPTRGSSYVTEFNPKTGQVRQWNECYDYFGNVNRVHPKTLDGQSLWSQHYPPTKAELDSWSNSILRRLK